MWRKMQWRETIIETEPYMKDNIKMDLTENIFDLTGSIGKFSFSKSNNFLHETESF